VVNEYFIGISIYKAKNFIRFSLNINFLAFRTVSLLVKIPAPITIGGTWLAIGFFKSREGVDRLLIDRILIDEIFS